MLSVQKHGTVSFNLAAYETMGKPEAVVVLWDPDERIFALCAAEASNPDAYTVQKQPAARSFLVNTQTFFRLAGIDVSTARRFAGQDFGNGIVGVKLDEGVEVGTAGRGRQAAIDEMLIDQAGKKRESEVERRVFEVFDAVKDSG